MKKLSLKTRLVLLHTAMMTVIFLVIAGVLFAFSSREILANVQTLLEEHVSEAYEYVSYRHERLEFDSDLLDLEDGVYLSVYEQDQELLYGKLPYGFPYDLPFEYEQVRKIASDGVEYYVLDIAIPVEGYHPVTIRGIASISEAESSFRFALRLTLVLFPLLILLTAICGYLLSRRALYPVDKITRTVQEIQKDKDLSKRIGLQNATDEIFTLAKTFDELLDTIEAGIKREKQFTSDVSHELRTPLAVIFMQCEEILNRDDLDVEVREQVEVVHKKVKALSDMVAQLLLLSRADQGRERLQVERLDLSELGDLVTDEFQDVAKAKNITMKADIQRGVYMEADQTLMIRLWNNLIQNAVQYGKENGHIWISLEERDGYIKLTIRDDGIGISQECLPHIWERFYQADPSRNSSENSGLGLSMVEWIVQAFHGEITVSSKPGQGTVFVCRFPVHHDKR